MTSKTAEPQTAEQLDRARALRRDEDVLEAEGPTIHLAGELADALLEARGWQWKGMARGWFSPDGVRYWHRDEALALALTAEALTTDAFSS